MDEGLEGRRKKRRNSLDLNQSKSLPEVHSGLKDELDSQRSGDIVSKSCKELSLAL